MLLKRQCGVCCLNNNNHRVKGAEGKGVLMTEVCGSLMIQRLTLNSCNRRRVGLRRRCGVVQGWTRTRRYAGTEERRGGLG